MSMGRIAKQHVRPGSGPEDAAAHPEAFGRGDAQGEGERCPGHVLVGPPSPPDGGPGPDGGDGGDEEHGGLVAIPGAVPEKGDDGEPVRRGQLPGIGACLGGVEMGEEQREARAASFPPGGPTASSASTRYTPR